MKTIKVIIDWENNYGAYSNEIPGCVATHKTLDGVKKAYSDALKFHLEGMAEDEEEIPNVLKDNFEFDFELNIRAILHYFDGVLTRSAISRVTGINQRQLGHYFSGHRNPRPEQQKKIVEGIRKIRKEIDSVV
ncbi:MAG: type II toxin-antitoxin system HicB family antitoxin [Mariniphaga sp.]|jgi:predicted RNase H-like HicB family nuclease|nr:type II toxin-antitoxin system HicB family antitoxin [Mariniphaga sp.]